MMMIDVVEVVGIVTIGMVVVVVLVSAVVVGAAVVVVVTVVVEDVELGRTPSSPQATSRAAASTVPGNENPRVIIASSRAHLTEKRARCACKFEEVQ
jgi:hypothetical protein